MSTELIHTEKPSFSKEKMAEVQEIIKHFPEGRQKSAILRILHMAEAEFGGWLSPETMDYVAEILSIEPIEVYEVASFYSMYNLEPVGKHVFEVCRTGPCMLVGSDQIIEHIEQTLDIKVGETTKDGMFTLQAVECLGACGYGPMLQCGKKYHEHLTKESVDQLIADFRSGKLPNKEDK